MWHATPRWGQSKYKVSQHSLSGNQAISQDASVVSKETTKILPNYWYHKLSEFDGGLVIDSHAMAIECRVFGRLLNSGTSHSPMKDDLQIIKEKIVIRMRGVTGIYVLNGMLK